MDKTVVIPSHETLFLEQGWYLALGFKQGWFVVRVVQKAWSNLQPWALGPVAANATLATADEIQDASNRHYLEPYNPDIIYHSFWGVTPTPAKIKWEFPVRTPLGSMLSISRTLTDGVGFIDGNRSPFWGPFSEATELFTVKDQYPDYNCHNPLNDAMTNVMLNFDQRQYMYEIVKDKALIKELLTGNKKCKKYTMGGLPVQLEAPGWIIDRATSALMKYTLDVMGGA